MGFSSKHLELWLALSSVLFQKYALSLSCSPRVASIIKLPKSFPPHPLITLSFQLLQSFWNIQLNAFSSLHLIQANKARVSRRCGHTAFLMLYSAYKVNKQGDNIQPWHTPFPVWNQSVVPCPVLTVASCIHVYNSALTSIFLSLFKHYSSFLFLIFAVYKFIICLPVIPLEVFDLFSPGYC